MKKVLILGGGCKKCKNLAEETKKAADSLGMQIDIEKVEDFAEITKFGVMTTPALVIDGDVKFSGKVLKAKDLVPYLQ